MDNAYEATGTAASTPPTMPSAPVSNAHETTAAVTSAASLPLHSTPAPEGPTVSQLALRLSSACLVQFSSIFIQDHQCSYALQQQGPAMSDVAWCWVCLPHTFQQYGVQFTGCNFESS